MELNLARMLPPPTGVDEAVQRVQRGDMLATERGHCGREMGEAALMRAVLGDAILCLQGDAPGVPRRDRPRAAAAALRWVNSRDLTWPFSFESICHVLGLDPEALRHWVRRRFLVNHRGRADSTSNECTEDDGAPRLRTLRLRGNTQPRRLTLRRYRPRPLRPR